MEDGGERHGGGVKVNAFLIASTCSATTILVI